MARKKKELRKFELIIKYICPYKNKIGIAVLNEYDFDFGSQDCDLCGSHGHLSIDVKCEHCRRHHEIDLRSW